MSIAIPPGQLKFYYNTTPATSTEPEVQDTKRNGTGPATTSENAQHNLTNGPKSIESDTNGPVGTPVLGNFESGWDMGITKAQMNGKTSIPNSESSQDFPSSSQPDRPAMIILPRVSNLKQLMDKIIEVDGRLDPKNTSEVPAASPWKLMRVKRNNQDLGTLFEMRDEFYMYKLPHLSKKSKK